MLEIKNLTVSVDSRLRGNDAENRGNDAENSGNKKILNNISLTINPGEVHAIMGPNGSGKSTLSNIIAGKDGYNIESGSITYKGENLLDMPVEERANKGIFLAFQYPVEIPGVTDINFLKMILNSKLKSEGKPEVNAASFLKLVRQKAEDLKMNEQLLYRSVNEGFSGGEKKRNEILQMSILEPELAILDETDSGLDIDALQEVATGVNKLRDSNRSFLVITHYQRLLNYIEPDFVHVLAHGDLIKSGGKELAYELEQKGYGWINGE